MNEHCAVERAADDYHEVRTVDRHRCESCEPRWEPSGLDVFAKPCHYRRCVLPVWHVGAHEVREVEG